MMQGTYTAALGIMSQQKRIDTIANNLANVSTNGYKSNRADFKDALYQTMQRVEQPQDNLNMKKGSGVLVSGFIRNFVTGFMNEGSETNCFMENPPGVTTFFAVRQGNGEVAYTRDGAFEKSVEADGVYLVTAGRQYVLDQNGQRIRLPEDGQLLIGKDGTISSVTTVKNEKGEDVVTTTPYAKIGIYAFPNPDGLELISGNMFAASANSGTARAAGTDEYSVVQGAYEGSNVDLAEEMSQLVRGTRMLQFSSRALSTADQMDETAISVRR